MLPPLLVIRLRAPRVTLPPFSVLPKPKASDLKASSPLFTSKPPTAANAVWGRLIYPSKPAFKVIPPSVISLKLHAESPKLKTPYFLPDVSPNSGLPPTLRAGTITVSLLALA